MTVVAETVEIQNIVKTVLRKRFPKVTVMSINVRDNEDEDGEKFIGIHVVFEAKKEDFDPAGVPSFTREVMGKLTEAKESRFPVFSFIAGSELGKMKPEAA